MIKLLLQNIFNCELRTGRGTKIFGEVCSLPPTCRIGNNLCFPRLKERNFHEKHCPKQIVNTNGRATWQDSTAVHNESSLQLLCSRSFQLQFSYAISSYSRIPLRRTSGDHKKVFLLPGVHFIRIQHQHIFCT